MTQLESAKKGKTTPEMDQAAKHEGVSPEEIRRKLAAGSAVIPKNRLRTFEARAIGQGLQTKINANIGTSAATPACRKSSKNCRWPSKPGRMPSWTSPREGISTPSWPG